MRLQVRSGRATGARILRFRVDTANPGNKLLPHDDFHSTATRLRRCALRTTARRRWWCRHERLAFPQRCWKAACLPGLQPGTLVGMPIGVFAFWSRRKKEVTYGYASTYRAVRAGPLVEPRALRG